MPITQQRLLDLISDCETLVRLRASLITDIKAMIYNQREDPAPPEDFLNSLDWMVVNIPHWQPTNMLVEKKYFTRFAAANERRARAMRSKRLVDAALLDAERPELQTPSHLRPPNETELPPQPDPRFSSMPKRATTPQPKLKAAQSYEDLGIKVTIDRSQAITPELIAEKGLFAGPFSKEYLPPEEGPTVMASHSFVQEQLAKHAAKTEAELQALANPPTTPPIHAPHDPAPDAT